MNVTITAGPASYTFWNCQKDPTLFPCSFAQERGGCRSQEIFVVQPIRRMYAPQINMSVDTRHWFFLLRDGVAVVYVSSSVGEKKILWIHTPLPSSAGPHNFFFLEQGMHFGALLTPVGQPDIVEAIHLSRSKRALLLLLGCSFFKLFWLLGFAACCFLQLKQLAQINRNLNSCSSLSKKQLNQPKCSRQKWAKGLSW